jgi:hypothetical protein
MIEMANEVAPSGITFDSSEQGQHFNFADHDVTNYNGIDERTLYYDCVTLQAGRTVRCGHVGFTKATTRVLEFWIVVGDRGPLRDVGQH